MLGANLWEKRVVWVRGWWGGNFVLLLRSKNCSHHVCLLTVAVSLAWANTRRKSSSNRRKNICYLWRFIANKEGMLSQAAIVTAVVIFFVLLLFKRFLDVTVAREVMSGITSGFLPWNRRPTKCTHETESIVLLVTGIGRQEVLLSWPIMALACSARWEEGECLPGEPSEATRVPAIT